MHAGTPSNPMNYQTHQVAMLPGTQPEIVLEHQDSTSAMRSWTPNRCEVVSRQLNKYIQPANCLATASGELCSYRDITPAMRVSSTEIRVLLYGTYYSSANCSGSNTILFNVPSPNFLQALPAGDTVVIQRKEIILKR